MRAHAEWDDAPPIEPQPND
jgi:hypothetical protein